MFTLETPIWRTTSAPGRTCGFSGLSSNHLQTGMTAPTYFAAKRQRIRREAKTAWTALAGDLSLLNAAGAGDYAFERPRISNQPMMASTTMTTIT